MGIFKRLHIRMRGTRSVIDHEETEEERHGPRRDFFRGPKPLWQAELIAERVLPPTMSPTPTTRDGAFMEPRGCNWWQSVANQIGPEAAQTSEIRCRQLPPVA